MEQVVAFIKSHINLRGEIKGLQRTDTLELPEAALREALINAMIHRDYTNQGRDIKVGVYDNTVTIVSPGGLPSALTMETLLDGRSEIRNRVVAKVFKELGYIEQWGSGLQRIRSACLAQDLKEPLIQERGDFVGVEFYRSPVEIDQDQSRSIGKVSEKEQDILDYLKSQKTVTSKQVETLTGLKEARARRILKEMIEKG